MTVLYYANSTKQDTVVCFRGGFADPNSATPPMFRLVQVPCPAGAQVPIFTGGDDDVNRIILQLGRQKVTPADELDRRQIDLIHGVFAVDKPVPMHKIGAIIRRNDELRNDRAFMLRKQLAVATHYKMNERAMELGPDAPRPHNVVMDLTEVTKPGEEPGGTETIEVATEGHEPVARKRAGGRRK